MIREFQMINFPTNAERQADQKQHSDLLKQVRELIKEAMSA